MLLSQTIYIKTLIQGSEKSMNSSSPSTYEEGHRNTQCLRMTGVKIGVFFFPVELFYIVRLERF